MGFAVILTLLTPVYARNAEGLRLRFRGTRAEASREVVPCRQTASAGRSAGVEALVVVVR
jgi:hypothetical protein